MVLVNVELTKEARVISNSGVMITETEIHVPLANGSKILIDLVSYPPAFLIPG